MQEGGNMEKEKKQYHKPRLVIEGDLASITKDVIAPGHGDVLAASLNIIDVLATS
jgi:hypothetical protein